MELKRINTQDLNEHVSTKLFDFNKKNNYWIEKNMSKINQQKNAILEYMITIN